MNIVDTRIMVLVDKTRKLYIRFEKDPTLREVEDIYIRLQEMEHTQVFREPETFVGMQLCL